MMVSCFKLQGSSLRSCLFISALIFFAGCASVSQSVRPREAERPSTPPAPSVPVSGDDLIKGIEEWRDNIRSLKGIARINIVSGEKETNAREVIAIRRPKSIRLETIGLFGAPAMILATDGVKCSIHITSEDKVLTWDIASPEVPIPLPFKLLETEEIADIFLGGTPVIKYGSVDLSYSDRIGVYTLTLHSRDGFQEQVLLIDAATLRLMRSEIADGHRGMIISLSFDNYQDIGGIWFPKRIEARFLPKNDTATISFEVTEINPKMEDELFVLSPPSKNKE